MRVMSVAALVVEAEHLIHAAKARGLMVAFAESCTGGLAAACITAVPGSSAVFERGYVTYSNAAKTEMLGVSPALIHEYGAVSEDVARAMARGALAHSRADIAAAITGVAGPDGGSADKPVGLVHIAAARRGGALLHEEMRFGAIGREAVREQSVATAYALVEQLIA
jgi:nicotinamide-nucleotide amidase